MLAVHFILYVDDQARSTAFYRTVLNLEPALDVPGMTEFHLADGVILGLMPEQGASALLDISRERMEAARTAPRAEVYLLVEDPAGYHGRALCAGAREVSVLSIRDWGHDAAYSLDPDGHVIAFARPAANTQ